jgi:hypothetical protein
MCEIVHNLVGDGVEFDHDRPPFIFMNDLMSRIGNFKPNPVISTEISSPNNVELVAETESLFRCSQDHSCSDLQEALELCEALNPPHATIPNPECDWQSEAFHATHHSASGDAYESANCSPSPSFDLLRASAMSSRNNGSHRRLSGRTASWSSRQQSPGQSTSRPFYGIPPLADRLPVSLSPSPTRPTGLVIPYRLQRPAVDRSRLGSPRFRPHPPPPAVEAVAAAAAAAAAAADALSEPAGWREWAASVKVRGYLRGPVRPPPPLRAGVCHATELEKLKKCYSSLPDQLGRAGVWRHVGGLGVSPPPRGCPPSPPLPAR